MSRKSFKAEYGSQGVAFKRHAGKLILGRPSIILTMRPFDRTVMRRSYITHIGNGGAVRLYQ